MKINFHRVLLGFFENWDKSSLRVDRWRSGGNEGFLVQYKYLERTNLTID